ncbi:MAG: fumarylacetoacetate hydrolase family protein [Hyphomicrobiales bacterium]|nr:fumarylacetoacetate hydrolase family protein [Hyphomicrobiales bacterium]
MKLVRFGAPEEEKPGLVDGDGNIRDLSGEVSDIDGAALAPASLKRLSQIDPAGLPLVSGKTRLGPCVGKISKMPAIGLNYADHAKEAGLPLPKEPVLFMKAVSAICGPNDDTIRPKDSTKLDHEVELGIVIGTRASYVSKDKALDHVAGYCIVNDVSERAFQIERNGGQWDKGKGCDTFAPTGPWMVTSDEIPDPQALDMFLEVNGERRQTGNTRTMIFGVADIVSDLSNFLTLMPGDVIITGTPPGVGLGSGKFLKVGDTVHLGIAGLGEQRQKIVAWPGK